MSEHMTQWLEAYHDGELHGRRLRQVDTHLETCPECRAGLSNLRSLSSLLQQVPGLETRISPEVFVAQVGLRLPRKPAQTSLKNMLHTGWRAAPVGLLGTWAFLQAAIFVTWITTFALRIFPEGSQLIEQLPTLGNLTVLENANLSGAALSGFGGSALDFLLGGGPLGWGLTLNLGLTVLVGLLYLSWIASWWITQTNENHKNVENGAALKEGSALF